MESVQEQAAIGGRCIHGTPTGTPGGYDLMCGMCEMGYTVKVERLTFDWGLTDPYGNWHRLGTIEDNANPFVHAARFTDIILRNDPHGMLPGYGFAGRLRSDHEWVTPEEANA